MAENKQSEGSPITRTKKKVNGMSAGQLDYLRPYFLGDNAGPQRHRYVLWVDIMGSQGKMLRSVRTASIPLMKLHVAALTAVKKNRGQLIELFPVIDGIYVVCEKLAPMEFFISDVFRSMAAEFLVVENWERSVVRGAIAYGPVILGKESKNGAAILAESNYADSILLGMPLVQAYVAERIAPPFGVFVHESVRAFGPTSRRPVTAVLWRWWERNAESRKIASALLSSLEEYYDWSQIHTVSTSYPVEKIEAHRLLAREYLSEFRSQSYPEPIAPKSLEASASSSRAAGRRQIRANSRSTAVSTGALLETQRKQPRLTDPEGQAQRLVKKLGLNEEQLAQIKPIVVERQEHFENAERDEAVIGKARTLRLRTIASEYEAKIEAILDEDQKKLFRASRRTRKEPGMNQNSAST